MDSSLSQNVRPVLPVFLELLRVCRRPVPLPEAPLPPPMVRNPDGCFELERVEARRLPKMGLSQERRSGKSIGRLVVMTEAKASRVPHSPASCAPLTGSC